MGWPSKDERTAAASMPQRERIAEIVSQECNELRRRSIVPDNHVCFNQVDVRQIERQEDFGGNPPNLKIAGLAPTVISRGPNFRAEQNAG